MCTATGARGDCARSQDGRDGITWSWVCWTRRESSPFNSHDLRKNDFIAHDTATQDGGEQRLEIDGVAIELDFVDGKTLSFKLWTPTPTELEDLEVHWLSPPRLDLKSGKGCARWR